MLLKSNIYLLIFFIIAILAASSLWVKGLYVIFMLCKRQFISWKKLEAYLHNQHGTLIIYNKGLIHKVLWTDLNIQEQDFQKINIP